MNNIRFLKRTEIDEQKWDELINVSPNSLPYAFSWYLDAVAENWGGLVLNNYETAMPLVWTRRMGLKCLYQPYYCQQLGVFSSLHLKLGEHRDFLRATAARFPYIHINLNPGSAIIAAEFSLARKKNLLLLLDKEYPAIQKNYVENHRRNIAKAVKGGLFFSEETDLGSFQKFYLENVNRVKENFKAKEEKVFRNLTRVLVARKVGSIFTAHSTTGVLLAAVLIIFHKKRLIAIINSSSATGKKSGASHFLFDQIIKKFSNSGLVLDFEGSSIASIARFYEGFGATEEVFYNYKNSLLTTISQRFR